MSNGDETVSDTTVATRRPRRRPDGGHPLILHAMLIVVCVIVSGLIAFTRGQDIDFDQLNYQFYSAYAYLTDRLGQDVAPAQVMHSYFSPYVYLPFYYMVRHWPPQMVGFGLGALQGLNLWLVILIAEMVTPPLPPMSRYAVIIAALVISAASPMAISELGTSYADVIISIPILAGLALLMCARFAKGRTARTAAIIGLAGALLGAAVSLKLTGAAYAVALAAASLVGWSRWRERATAFIAAGIGGGVGFVLCGGSWYLRMWRTFGNPVFPYYNTIFRSPDYQARFPLFDNSYVPHSILAGLSYPFLWLQTRSGVTTEVAFRDIRFALLIILALAALTLWAIRHKRSAATAIRSTPEERRLVVFIIVAFGVWMYLWSIQRYLVGIELLMGPAFVVALRWGGFFEMMRERTLIATAALGAMLCVITVRFPDWAHIGWRKSWYEVDVPATSSDHPVYFLVGGSLSFVVPELKPGSTVIDVMNWEDIPSWGDTVFLRRIKHVVADPQNGPIWAVAADPIPDSFRETIRLYGLDFAGECQKTKARPWPLTWCPLVRTAPTN